MLSGSLAALCVAAALLCGPASADQAQPVGIKKVIILLNEMKAQVEKEAEEDQVSYDKYNCWCETSNAEKTAAVEEAQKKIAELEAFLEEAAGLTAKLLTEIGRPRGLTGDIGDDTEADDTATAQRKKENDAFLQEEADLKECTGALGEAIAVLSKVQLIQKKGGNTAEVAAARASLLQVQRVAQKGSPAMEAFRGVIQKDLYDALDALDEVAPSGKFLPRREMSALAQHSRLLPWEKTEEQVGKEAKPNDLQGAAAGAKSYNSRSGQIVGLLSQMKDEFVASLAVVQKEELEALISYQKLHAAKLAEIAAASKAKASKEGQVADLGEQVAQAKEDVAATKEALSADEKFLVDLAEMCASAKDEFAARVKVRTEEIRALGEVIQILTSDDTRDLFGKTLAGGIALVQTGMDQNAVQRQAVQKAVQRVIGIARKHKDWILASMAVRTQLDAFVKVKKMMDQMLAELQAQQKAEYAKWESCKGDLDETDDKIRQSKWDKEDLEEKKLGHENHIAALENDIENLKSDIAEMQVSLKKAGEDRKAENELFQQSVSDQRATIQILKKALARLEEFYAEKKAKESLLQKHQKPGQADTNPPPRPTAYRKNEGAGGVMQVIQMVIEDAGREEAQMIADEQAAQKSYAMFAQDATDSIEADRKSVAEKQATLADTQAALSETEEALLAKNTELQKLAELDASLHAECDYLLKYFDVRQKARKEEMDSIVDAKAILSGADFGSA